MGIDHVTLRIKAEEFQAELTAIEINKKYLFYNYKDLLIFVFSRIYKCKYFFTNGIRQ